MMAETTNGIRLISRYVDYAPERGVYLWREWPKGKIVSDPEEIKFLESRGAPVERIDT
jgi:hypothetical protein